LELPNAIEVSLITAAITAAGVAIMIDFDWFLFVYTLYVVVSVLALNWIGNDAE
jgi:hypothetical protein